MRWQILSEKKDVLQGILKNRNIKDSNSFLNPIPPENIQWKDLGIKEKNVKLVVDRIKKAKKNKERVVVFGDYDADGVCSTAILWEGLREYGLDVLPYIPDRFEEGYGIKATSFEVDNFKKLNPKLIITIDNGIVATEAIKKAKNLNIDVIVIDHHERGRDKLDTKYVLHTTKVCASGLAYFFTRSLKVNSGLDLAAIGTIADQIPLTGVNRSLVKYGLDKLKDTRRVGLKTLFYDAKIKDIGTYEVNYVIAPRINAMGRLGHALDSLRLICTNKKDKAQDLSNLLNKTNSDRQKIVEKVVLHTKENKIDNNKIIVLSHKSYHEGVIGLAAGKLVEEYYRPSIVLSEGLEVSKASARSIPGFNIIEAIRKLKHLYIEGGGHAMAAGFSIKTVNIEKFKKEINEIANEILTDEIMEKKLIIDCKIDFDQINSDLVTFIKKIEPFGNGNYPPVFMSSDIEILEIKKVGNTGNHLKLKLKQNDMVLDAIWFNSPVSISDLKSRVDIAYSVEENIWNNRSSIQLKIRDCRLG